MTDRQRLTEHISGLYARVEVMLPPHAVGSLDALKRMRELAITGLAGPARPQWQPIETALLDGTEMLLASWGQDGYGEIDVGNWGFIEKSDWDGQPVYGWMSNYGRVEPTHWMPLPESPSPATGESKS